MTPGILVAAPTTAPVAPPTTPPTTPPVHFVALHPAPATAVVPEYAMLAVPDKAEYPR